MARIRSIKPELRTSITVSSWPMEVRYFFVLLWGYLDDYGRGVDDELLIASDCFPRDRHVTPDVVDGWLETMADSGPVCRYEVDGKPYLHCPSWAEHQKPQHPGKPRVPPCPDCEPGPFDEWRRANPPRIIRRSRKSREDLTKSSPARSSAPERASERPSETDSETSTATVIQMPGQIGIDHGEDTETAGHGHSGNPHEDVGRTTGDTQEILTPEQGAGSREQGAGREERAGARELVVRGHSAPPARRPDGLTSIPDDFTITDGMRRWAHRDGYADLIDIDHSTAQFTSHYRATGARRRSWPDAWQKWIRDDHKRAAERGTRTTGTQSRQQQETDAWFDRAMNRAITKDQQEAS
ncbi:hypothetical protein ACPC54_23890 [Kitasatospora sp. NPDC094028]